MTAVDDKFDCLGFLVSTDTRSCGDLSCAAGCVTSAADPAER